MMTANGRFWTTLAKTGCLAFILGGSLLPTPTYADLLDDIQERGSITVATEMRYAPFDMIVDGRYQGLCKDLFDAVARDLSRGHIRGFALAQYSRD